MLIKKTLKKYLLEVDMATRECICIIMDGLLEKVQHQIK